MSLRFKIPPGDVTPAAAARHMGLSIEEFREKLPALRARDFPPPDETTGNYDIDAIDRWRRARHPQFFPAERFPEGPGALDAKGIDVRARLAALRPRSAAR